MAAQDSKLTGLTELTSASADDILYIVNDPAGTALGQKITVDNLFNYVSFGTANTLAKFSSGGGLEDSSITDDGTTVTISSVLDVTGDSEINADLNIGTTSTSRTLDVYGSLNQYSSTGNSQRVQLDLYATGPTGTRARQAAIGAIRNSGDDGGQLEFFVTNSGGTLFEAANLEDHAFNVNVATNILANLAVDTDTLFVDASTGRVGINESSPSYPLDVAGQGRFSDTLRVEGTSLSRLALLERVDGGNNAYIIIKDDAVSSANFYVGQQNGVGYFGGSGLGASGINTTIDLTSGNVAMPANLAVDTNTLYVDAVNNNVGIRTSTPNSSYALDVQAIARIQASTNPIIIESTLGTLFSTYKANSVDVGFIGSGSGVVTGGGDTNFGLRAENDLIFASGGNNQRMQLDSSGNLAVDTDTLYVDAVNDTVNINGASSTAGRTLHVGGEVWINAGNDLGFRVLGDSGMTRFSGTGLALQTNNTNRLTIDSSGNVSVIGALSKGSGSFKIDHPLPSKKETHHLVHSFVEAPTADNIYRGVVSLVNGLAEVNIDQVARMTEGTFVLLNDNVQAFVNNQNGFTPIKATVNGNILTLESETPCNDSVSWLVIGERIDQHMIDTDWTDESGKVIVEPLKQN